MVTGIGFHMMQLVYSFVASTTLMVFVATTAQALNETVIPLNNQGVEALNAGRLDEAIAKFSKAVTVDPDYALAKENLAVSLNRRGLAFYRRKDYTKASADFQKSLSLIPSPEVHLNNSAACMRLKQFQRAFDDAQRANSPEMKGLAMLGLANLHGAIAELNKVQPPTHLSLIGLSISYQKLGDPKSSRKYKLRVSSKNLEDLAEWQKVFQVTSSKLH